MICTFIVLLRLKENSKPKISNGSHKVFNILQIKIIQRIKMLKRLSKVILHSILREFRMKSESKTLAELGSEYFLH